MDDSFANYLNIAASYNTSYTKPILSVFERLMQSYNHSASKGCRRLCWLNPSTPSQSAKANPLFHLEVSLLSLSLSLSKPPTAVQLNWSGEVLTDLKIYLSSSENIRLVCSAFAHSFDYD